MLIAVVKKETDDNTIFKIAISLRKLLESNGNLAIKQSYDKIATTANIRKATVSNTFNAKSVPNSLTLFLIIEAMGFSLIDFSKIYDSIVTSDIESFKFFLAEQPRNTKK
ncbi:MAG: hypothetical protein KAF41_00340 [Flavobacterium sp.]|jgi:DNA-binding phage protein|uniref:hypothetical protein n=1 Tax=Flavobacterium lindanitolerans TaxID=428988 RepID=UPI000DB49541|nr:hypothetical protein [Flavobacterium lindanitolerans]MBU7569076.1 hypothetical protein [Flavobacterium sp.]PZO27842.1 MAG: hypothetical protein DCE86_12765 [Flavobacteriaceae bacterium]THD34163.1 MAG: hypothetical protein DI588_03200 [Flavobacterium johnsoniae]